MRSPRLAVRSLAIASAMLILTTAARAAPDATAIGAKKPALVNELVFDDGDYPWQDYSLKLYALLYRAWLRELYKSAPLFDPSLKKAGLTRVEGEVKVRFVIRRAGTVDHIAVAAPSKLPAFDGASCDAVAHAILPPLPRDFPRDEERVTMTFRLQGFESSRQLIEQLERARSNGEF
jgi:TonB family protein